MRHGPEKERLLKLTLAVYKVTAIFPIGEEGDKLGAKIRQLADRIKNNENDTSYIEKILSLFDLVEKKNWVDPRNFLVLRREYEIIRPSAYNSNGNRQDRILEAINGNDTIKISDFARLLPGVNRRTILRDLDKLCQTGVMTRNGNGRGAHYAKCDMSH